MGHVCGGCGCEAGGEARWWWCGVWWMEEAAGCESGPVERRWKGAGGDKGEYGEEDIVK